MNLIDISIDDLRHDPNNARSHDEKNLQSVQKSLEAFGQQKPIVIDSEKTIIAGNATAKAASMLGWKKIQAIQTNLSGKEAAAFAIADNRTAELAEWDFSQLGKTFEELALNPELLGATGFDLDDIDQAWQTDEEILSGEKYDESKHESYTIKISEVSHDEKDELLQKINSLLNDLGAAYQAKAF